MPKVIICRGIQASGKTSFAKELVAKGGWTRVNKDDLRAMLHNGNHTNAREKQVLKIRDSVIIQALRAGQNVVVDDTNLAFKHIERIAEVVESQAEIDNAKYTWEVKDFEITLYEAIKRDAKRPVSVGEKVIRDTWNSLVRPGKKIEQDSNAPDAVIFDMDGTLALLNGRDPYDATDCEYDLLNKPVFDDLRRLQADGFKIIIFSGRKDTYLEPTDRWLTKHGIKPDLFAMRRADDDRPDNELKEEFFRTLVLGKFNVDRCYDDRNRVVDMYRDLGLTVYQVADGCF